MNRKILAFLAVIFLIFTIILIGGCNLGNNVCVFDEKFEDLRNMGYEELPVEEEERAEGLEKFIFVGYSKNCSDDITEYFGEYCVYASIGIQKFDSEEKAKDYVDKYYINPYRGVPPRGPGGSVYMPHNCSGIQGYRQEVFTSYPTVHVVNFLWQEENLIKSISVLIRLNYYGIEPLESSPEMPDANLYLEKGVEKFKNCKINS